VRVLNPDVVVGADLDEDTIDAVVAREAAELARREERYRGDRPPAAIAGRTVVVVDDGLATGATMRAAVAALRDRGAARIVVATPVGSDEARGLLGASADAVVCPLVPGRFRAVGAWYVDFAPVEDDEVRALLARAAVPSAVRGS
jgi:predicted phosphoribosyltransferase